jgi:hypothetical protein
MKAVSCLTVHEIAFQVIVGRRAIARMSAIAIDSVIKSMRATDLRARKRTR